MAESFILSPLYCGSKTTGYRPRHAPRGTSRTTRSSPGTGAPALDAMTGYGDDIRLGTAISVSGAAASPNAGYHSSPLVTILMTMLNARLGLWFGNPARAKWRRSGPNFAFYLLGELLGRTTNKRQYVNLSDGGHFENLGAYELVRRRCRYIVVCDAGADPGSRSGTSAAWCALPPRFRHPDRDRHQPVLEEGGHALREVALRVGQIHYDDVDVGASQAR